MNAKNKYKEVVAFLQENCRMFVYGLLVFFAISLACFWAGFNYAERIYGCTNENGASSITQLNSITDNNKRVENELRVSTEYIDRATSTSTSIKSTSEEIEGTTNIIRAGIDKSQEQLSKCIELSREAERRIDNIITDTQEGKGASN